MVDKILNNIRIDTNIFKNGSIGGVQNITKIHGLDSAYEIWEEANRTILNSNGNNEILNQGFLSLKRAFNVTSIELKKHLAIDKIGYDTKKSKKDFLGDLEYFEIIKTLTLSKYLKIRNLIEHENHKPLSIEDCLSLSEYIWNYIRNTANILNQFMEVIIFSDYKGNNRIIFEYITEKKGKEYFPHLYITSLLQTHLISFLKIDNSINVENIKLLNKFDVSKRIEFEKECDSMGELNVIAFSGEILNQQVISLYIKHLILPEFGGLDEESIKSIF